MLCAHAEGSERAEDTLQLRCIGSGIFLDTDDGGVPGDSATGWAPGTGLPGGFDSGGEDYDGAFCALDAAGVCGNGGGGKVQGQPEAGDLQWRSAWGINPDSFLERMAGVELIILYGPTEAAVEVSH